MIYYDANVPTQIQKRQLAEAQRRQCLKIVTMIRQVEFSLKVNKKSGLCINLLYVVKQQKRAKRSETKALLFNAYPKGRRSRIHFIQKVGGCLFNHPKQAIYSVFSISVGLYAN